MNFKQLGATGIRVPELALGTWQYRGGVNALRAGIDLGACFIDTAECYGTEPDVGKAIRGIRNSVLLASKVSPRHFRYWDVIRAAECSLKQLNTDYLDLYQLHWPNYAVRISETMSAMERLVEMGKIRFIGVSNFSVSELERAAHQLSSVRIASLQVKYNVADRAAEEEILPYCEAQGISVLAYSPLDTSLNELLRADRKDILGQIGLLVNKTRAQVALNWCLSHSPVIAIFKADKVEHMKEDCGASGWYLTSEQRRLLNEGIPACRNRNGAERFARKLARRMLQWGGRNLGAPTAMDLDSRSEGN